jgi:hypothetical protein
LRRCAPHDTLTVWVTGATQARAIFLNEKVDPFDADLTDEIRDKCWLDGCVCVCVCVMSPTPHAHRLSLLHQERFV